MNKQDFNRRVVDIINGAKSFTELENTRDWFGQPINMFLYAAICEKCQEDNMFKGKRETTFMADFSCAEYGFGLSGVLDTFKNAAKSWRDDERYMAEMILVMNFKSWEHYERKHTNWSRLYTYLYECLRDLVYDYYENDEKKTSYVWSYLD